MHNLVTAEAINTVQWSLRVTDTAEEQQCASRPCYPAPMGNRTFRPTTRHSHTRLWPGRGMNRRAASASRAPPTTMEDPQVAVATHIGPSPRVSQSPESDMSPRAKRSLSPSPAPDSQSSSLAYSGDNEEEYLRATWQRLGVGHDGYLSLEELATVCHAIGMEKVANEVLEQLFSRLDVDGDGRISFEEFVHMFQNGGPSGNNSLVLDDSLPPDVPGSTLSCMSSASDERRGMVMSESSVFSSLDPDSTGQCAIENTTVMQAKKTTQHYITIYSSVINGNIDCTRALWGSLGGTLSQCSLLGGGGLSGVYPRQRVMGLCELGAVLQGEYIQVLVSGCVYLPETLLLPAFLPLIIEDSSVSDASHSAQEAAHETPSQGGSWSQLEFINGTSEEAPNTVPGDSETETVVPRMEY
ncbi:Ninein-like protein [Portunus trituberculatus]|uniref:Ninein-like protein n=1 Tax=Portunus trituberculatus TaxID=210409 RepID=A0A5B7DP06_PORTR|nr:Ninein-like protein [Portunus trituberculatus]